MAVILTMPFRAASASSVGGGGATTGNENRRMYDTVTGTPSNGAHPDGVANHYSCHVNVVSSFEQVSINNAPTRVRFGFHLWVVADAVTAAWQVASAVTAAGSRHQIRQATTGQFQALVAGGTAQDIIVSPVHAQMYWIEVLVDVSTGTHTMDTWVDGVKQTQASFAIAASTITGVAAGNSNATGTGDYWVSDMVVSDTPDDPIGEHYVIGFVPTGTGTHVMTTGDFTNNSAANVIVGETASPALIDEWPANITDYVQQVVLRSTSLLEYTFTPIAPVGYPKPTCMRIDGALFPVGAATANNIALRLRDTVGGVTTAEALWDNSIASNTLEYHANFYPKRPSTLGPWDRVSLEGARVNYGFSTDATPPPALSSLLMTVAYAEASLPGGTPLERPRRTRKLRR